MRLRDKVVVITGAGSGMGRDCAILFASEGAHVVVTDLSADRSKTVASEVADAGGEEVWMKADVRIHDDMNQAVELAMSTHGRLDVMMANAGIAEVGFGSIPFDEISVENWQVVQDTNLKGVFLASQAAFRVMKHQGYGNIVVTSSASALSAYPGFYSYTPSKHGVNGLVKTMSWGFGKFGIRVNALCPTHGMSANLALPADADVLGLSYEELAGPWVKDNAAMPLRMDRPPRIRDNSHVALFLASDESEYMSGVCLPSADGGTHARVAINFPE